MGSSGKYPSRKKSAKNIGRRAWKTRQLKNMFDVYKFIECVQENTPIWDNTSKDYMNKPVKEVCWNNVAQDVFPNWLEMTSEQKENQMKEMKNKWRHVRDSYIKFTNHNRRNVAAKQRKYMYAESLKFLENYIPARRANYRAANKEEDVKMNIGEQQVQKFEEVLLDTPDIVYIEQVEEESMQAAYPPPPESHQISLHQQSPIEQKVISGFQRQQPAHSGGQSEEFADPDKCFLLSILTDYKMLSYEQKLDFRMYALGFFKRINLQNSQINLNNSQINLQNYQ